MYPARSPKTYSQQPTPVMCLWCGEATEAHPDGRPRLYCSGRCRVAAHRHKAKTKSAG